jgi:alkaline phosphatase D
MSFPRRTLLCWGLLLCLPAAAAAADPVQPLRRIAFGSCAHQDRPQPIWDAVVASKPDLFLFIGDTVYADTTDMDVMRAKYAKLAALPGWQKLWRTCPVFATWDDHDYGANDAGAEYPKKVESQKVFLEFFREPKDSPRWRRPGVYHARVFGPPGNQVQVILLDTRYFRSPLKKRPRSNLYDPNPDPAATFLGAEQWKWLGEQLKVPARVRLIASSIQVIAEDHGFEKWMNFPHERQRLFDLIRDTQAGGVLFLSGDRHLAELSQTDDGAGYPLFDLTSSGLNQADKRWRRVEVNRHRVATMPYGDNFGLVAIDWDRDDPRVSLQIRDVDGDVTIQQKIPLSLLQPVPAPTGGVLTPAQAARLVNRECTVEMRVLTTGASKTNDRVFLNSAKNFRDADNFTAVLEREALDKLKQDKVEDARAHFLGKTVRVTGTVTRYNDRPEILVKDPKQIQVVAP